MMLKKNIAISDSGFIFHPETGESYSLNPIGLEILQQIKEGNDQEEIIEMLIVKYDVTKIMAERYYLDFIQSLKKEIFFE